MFNLNPGTYTEGNTITPILGASATNTITFDGTHPDSVTVSHDGTSQNAVFALLGADYVTLTNMTIENTKPGTDAWGVRLADTADYNIISNNVILMSQTATSDNVGILASASATSESTEGINANYTQILNNTIIGGDKSIRFEGLSATFDIGNQFIGNDLSLADESGIYLDNQDQVVIVANYIHDLRNATTADGIYAFDLMNFTIMENRVSVVDYGIYVSDGNFDFTPTQRGTIVNNMVRSTGDYGIYLDDITDVDVFHNTSYGEPGIRINDFPGIDVRNNIFVSNGDFAFEADDVVDTVSVNYNIYWSGGANLVDVGPSVFADLAAWQAAQATINDASLEGDPGFISATDLHLIGTLANDVGDNTVGVSKDIDGDSRPLAPSTIVDIGADEYTPADNDAVLVELLTGAGGCGDSMTAITVVVKNQGLLPITSMDVFADVTGSITQSLTAPYMGSLLTGQLDTISLGTINTYAGGSYGILAYTQLIGDQDNSNDTMMFAISRFSSAPPTAMQVADICVGESAQLVAMGSGPKVWYDSLSGGTVLAMTDTFNTPAVQAPTTYYVGNGLRTDSIETTFAAGNGCGGGNMFDVTAISGIQINGFTISPNFASGTSDTLKVWYIPNETYLGNETTAAAWTLLDAVEFTSQGDAVPVKVNVNSIQIPAGATYAIYLEYNANYTELIDVFANANIPLALVQGYVLHSVSFNAGRTFNGIIHYQTMPCTMTVRL